MTRDGNVGLVERLVSLVPPPRAHEVHYHGVLAPAASWRSAVVPPTEAEQARRRTLSCRPRSSRPERWSWADLLRRVFLVDATACPRCGGVLSVVEVVGAPWSPSQREVRQRPTPTQSVYRRERTYERLE